MQNRPWLFKKLCTSNKWALPSWLTKDMAASFGSIPPQDNGIIKLISFNWWSFNRHAWVHPSSLCLSNYGCFGARVWDDGFWRSDRPRRVFSSHNSTPGRSLSSLGLSIGYKHAVSHKTSTSKLAQISCLKPSLLLVCHLSRPLPPGGKISHCRCVPTLRES